MTVYAAYLRVYEPMGAFDAPAARRWRDALAAGELPDRAGAALAEHRAAMARVFGTGAASVADPPALAIVDDGVTYVCPLDLPLRRFAALTDFNDGLPGQVAQAFVPAVVADRIAAEHAAWLGDEGSVVVPHVQTARWQVPLRWFVAFEPAERRLALGDSPERPAEGRSEEQVVAAAGLGRALGYVTAMSRARRRVARTLAVLRRTLEDGPIVEGIEDLGRWLEEFHPHSLVELDYGGLVHLLDDDALAADTSAADVAAAVEALRAGDGAATAAAYERVVSRWRRLASIESAS